MNTTEHKKATKAFFEKWSVKEVSERGGYIYNNRNKATH